MIRLLGEKARAGGRFQSVMATQCSAINFTNTSVGFRQLSVLRAGTGARRVVITLQ
ncbi:MAG: hypothetical protein ACRDSR_07585 [Pseudonocardiaceae bacterium]